MWSQDPLLIAPQIDAEAYHIWARQILQDPVGKEVFFQSPAYPYTLAGLYALFGEATWVVAVFQCVMGASGVWLMAILVRRLVPHTMAWTALVAAWIYALYQPFIFYDVLLLKVELSNFFTLLLCLLLVSGEPGQRRAHLSLFGAGVVLAWLGLYRGNFYLAFPLLALWLLVRVRWWRGVEERDVETSEELDTDAESEGLGEEQSFGWRVGLWQAGAFVCGFALVLGLVTIRNYAVSGQWVTTTAGGGTVLYYGNNPYSANGEFAHLPFVRSSPQFERMDFQNEASRRLKRKLTIAEADAYWRKEAMAYILKNPWITTKRVWHKLLLTLQAYEQGDNYSLKFHSLFSPVLRFLLPWWALILALSLPALILLRGRWWRWMPILLLSFAYLCSLLIFFVSSRYRIPMVPLLLPLLALEIGVLVQWLRGGERSKLLGHTLMIVCLLSVSLSLGQVRQSNEKLGIWWSYLAARHIEKGDRKRGLRLYRMALKEEPRNGTIWMNMGRFLLSWERPRQAIWACRNARKFRADKQSVQECLALSWFRLGQIPRALQTLRSVVHPAMPIPRTLLWAVLLERSGRRNKAVAALQNGLRRHGMVPEVLAHLARILRPTKPGQAKGYLQQALKRARNRDHARELRRIAGF